MASHPGSGCEPSCGRGFASIDPERQREVVGYVRVASIETTTVLRIASTRATRLDWTRMQSERDSATFEGSSSRRSR
jgi:hypothetical protein